MHEEQVFNDLWRTVPGQGAPRRTTRRAEERRRALLQLPQENLLYFLEKTAPRLQPWQREILRIVRIIAQYFYPQQQTKVMNEGCATFVHYRIMNRLHEKGLITDGTMLEFLRSHTNVVFQPDFDDPRYSGINPYALGFAMMRDIERICTEPTAEDREWFPDIAGTGDPMAVLRDVWANYRDESFILQYPEPAADPRVPAVPRARRRERAEPARRGDPRRARLSQDPARAGAAVRHRLDAAGHPGGRRQPGRRPPADPASPRAQPRAAGRARRALRAAAPGRSVGLRRADEGDRSGHRLGAEGARGDAARRHPAARRVHSRKEMAGCHARSPSTFNLPRNLSDCCCRPHRPTGRPGERGRVGRILLVRTGRPDDGRVLLVPSIGRSRRFRRCPCGDQHSSQACWSCTGHSWS